MIVAILNILLIFHIATAPAVTAVTVDCYFIFPIYNYARQYVYSCYVHNPDDFTDASNEIEGFTGDHMSRKTIDDVTGFYLKSSRELTAFPKGIKKIVKNVTAIAVEDNRKLEAVTSDDLQPFPELRCLYLSYNGLTSIEADLFQHNKELEVIYIEHNRIKSIHAMVFSDLKNLRALGLRNIECKQPMDVAVERENVEELVKRIEGSECVPDATEAPV